MSNIVGNPEPTMEDQDIFHRWLNMVSNRDNVWKPETYGSFTSVGKMFDRPAQIEYVYCLGNSHAAILVHPLEDKPETGVDFRIFVQQLQGIQLYVGNPGAANGCDFSLPVRNYQLYNLQEMVNFIENRCKIKE